MRACLWIACLLACTRVQALEYHLAVRLAAVAPLRNF